MSAGRLVWWFVLASFPVLIAGLIRWFPLDDSNPDVQEFDTHEFWSLAIYLLVPCITCAMGVLLSAGPAIATELEQRSWIYLATRPNGIFWLLIGKYIVAVGWATTAAVAGLSIAVQFSQQDTMFQIWLGAATLSLLSSMSYAAVFLLIGTLFPQRAMLFCVMWTAVVEGLVSFIPAIINRLTIQYRLRTLFVDWLQPTTDIEDIPTLGRSFGEGPWYLQICWLVALSALFLAAAQVIAHKREFTAAAESDV